MGNTLRQIMHCLSEYSLDLWKRSMFFLCSFLFMNWTLMGLLIISRYFKYLFVFTISPFLKSLFSLISSFFWHFCWSRSIWSLSCLFSLVSDNFLFRYLSLFIFELFLYVHVSHCWSIVPVIYISDKYCFVFCPSYETKGVIIVAWGELMFSKFTAEQHCVYVNRVAYRKPCLNFHLYQCWPPITSSC